jgi:hypothetical protein
MQLLCNIHPTSLYKVNGNVPPIYTVFSDASSSSSHNTTSKPKTYVLTRNGRQVQKRLEHGSELFSLDKIPPPCLVRLAYMRLETTIYAKSGITTRAAQWGPIDKQLIFLRTQTGDYNLA